MAKRAVPGKKGIHPAVVLAAVLAIGLIVRMIFLLELERSGLGDALSLDARLYRDVAHDIIAGGKLHEGALTFNPLYPAFLVVMFRLFGEGLLAPRIVQLFIGLLTVVLIYLAGLRLAGDLPGRKSSGTRAAIIAAAVAALYSRFILYEGMLLATTLDIFLISASFLLALALDADLRGERLVRIGSRHIPPWLSGLLLGALCGAGALGRPNLFLLLIAALPIWLYGRNFRQRRGLIPAVCCIIGAVIFLAPPIVYNAAQTGRLVPIAAHGGINFYIGNNPRSEGVFKAPEDMRGSVLMLSEDAKAEAEAKTGRRMTDPEVSDFYVREALDAIRLDPAAWLRLLGKKLILFFNADVPDMPDVFVYERSLGIFKFAFVPFSVIAPLGLCGLVVLFRSGRHRSIVSLFLGCVILSVMLFFVNERYRLPVVPFLILLAGLFIEWAMRELKQKRLKGVAVLGAAAVVFFFLVSSRDTVKTTHSAAYTFLGSHYLETGNEERAAEAFAEAYRRSPEKMEAIVNYARILRRQERIPEAVGLYSRAYARDPHYPLLAIEYGLTLALLGRHEEAKKLYLEAAGAKNARERVFACGLLAERATAEGKKDEAIVWLKRGIEIDPANANLAGMLRMLEGSE